MPAPIDWKPYVEAGAEEVKTVAGTLKDKGAKRFGRALGAAAFMVFAAYMGVYLPPQKKSARLQAQIDQAKTMAESSAQYKDVRDRLASAYLGLPAIEARDQWLTNAVRDSLTVSGLVTEAFKPIREAEQNGLVYQTSEVTLNVKFSEFFDWLLKLEGAQPLMQLQRFSLSKKAEGLGANGVTCEVATVIPKRRYR